MKTHFGRLRNSAKIPEIGAITYASRATPQRPDYYRSNTGIAKDRSKCAQKLQGANGLEYITPVTTTEVLEGGGEAADPHEPR